MAGAASLSVRGFGSVSVSVSSCEAGGGALAGWGIGAAVLGAAEAAAISLRAGGKSLPLSASVWPGGSGSPSGGVVFEDAEGTGGTSFAVGRIPASTLASTPSPSAAMSASAAFGSPGVSPSTAGLPAALLAFPSNSAKASGRVRPASSGGRPSSGRPETSMDLEGVRLKLIAVMRTPSIDWCSLFKMRANHRRWGAFPQRLASFSRRLETAT